MNKLTKLKEFAKRHPKKLIVTLAVAALTTMVLTSDNTIKPKTNRDLAKVSVMITNLQRNSGGTGVIVESDDLESLVLTNKHVCGVAEEGGFVLHEGKQWLVTEYATSKYHDLCVIRVKDDLGIGVKVADRPPNYMSSATVVGHPKLLPTIVVTGHFSGHIPAPILTAVRKCTDKDLADPEIGQFCRMFGGAPVIEVYDAQVLSDMIAPGNSGSAVFNSEGELAGVVFASMSREVSYAFIVPQQYIRGFLYGELKRAEWKIPHIKTPSERDEAQRAATDKDIEKFLKIKEGSENE